ncbi:MAG: leucyl aminopeptidase [Planctomycetes bacterium]|nr:leucyl aminopeptidase [Planctomycetota bacterium]
MKITTKERDLTSVRAPLHVQAVFDDHKGVPASISKTALGDFDGKPRSFLLSYLDGEPVQRLALVGLGSRANAEVEWIRRVAATVVAKARAMEFSHVAIDWSVALEVLDEAAVGRAAAEGVTLAAYEYRECKSAGKTKRSQGIKNCTFVGGGAAFKRGVREGFVRATGACFARDLGNAPGNHLTPTQMAAEARKLAQGDPRITCKVLDEAEMKKLGMGSLLCVSQGSTQPAKLIHLRYQPKARKPKGKVAIVGKGLTFDSGGISIKPARGMEEMKFDMCGAAAVLGVFRALRDLALPIEVHGIVASAENMPSGSATKPGDVVRAMNGKTIEVLNTDAEGRLVLADALGYTCSKVKPDAIVDLATLTGAVVVGLGHEVTGIMGEEDLVQQIARAGETVGERCWPLPLWDVHKEQMKSDVADLRNINSPADGGGSMAGGAFLSYFVEPDIPWVHMDIAGTAWGGRNRDYYTGKGASGVGVRLLLQWLDDRK